MYYLFHYTFFIFSLLVPITPSLHSYLILSPSNLSLTPLLHSPSHFNLPLPHFPRTLPSLPHHSLPHSPSPLSPFTHSITPPPLTPPSLTPSFTHSLALSPPHSLFTHSLTPPHSLPHSHSPHSPLTHSLTLPPQTLSRRATHLSLLSCEYLFVTLLTPTSSNTQVTNAFNGILKATCQSSYHCYVKALGFHVLNSKSKQLNNDLMFERYDC